MVTRLFVKGCPKIKEVPLESCRKCSYFEKLVPPDKIECRLKRQAKKVDLDLS